ncbi:ATP-binding protein [Streptomyces sp. MMS24-I2-30]|uniref:ATP-binding protein n=1 Tax=Streptomyces sp. MMS24-I2-30 TaxID=3351564 RepID=UPI003896CDD4
MTDREVTEPPRLRHVLPFEATSAGVPMLRRAAVKQLGRWSASMATDEAELLVTELATNVLKHVGEGVSAALVLEWGGGRLRLEMHDGNRVLPVLKSANCDEECGRGLHLLAALAADWGTVVTAAGKAVWCEIEVDSTGACRRLVRAAEVLENYQGASAAPTRSGHEADLEESAIELIADLLHWTAAHGHEPVDVLHRAQMYYEDGVGAA